MGRPKKAAARKPLAKKDTNVPVQFEDKPGDMKEDAQAPESSEDHEERTRVVNLVCDAVYQEVKSRSAGNDAIRDGHIASITTQLQLLLSKYPAHIRKMPMKKFLKEYCPNTEVNTRPDGTLQLNIMQEPTFTMEAQAPGSGTVNTEFDMRVNNTPGHAPYTSVTEQFGQTVSKHLAGQKRDKEQLSWDEFLMAYRMQSATKGTSALESPSLRTPGMNWRDAMISRNMTPMTEKVFPKIQQRQIGTTQLTGTKRKLGTSRGLRM